MRTRRIALLGAVLGLGTFAACGSESGGGTTEDAGLTIPAADAKADSTSASDAGREAASSSDATSDVALADAGAADAADAADASLDAGPACDAGATCFGNAGAPCRVGVISCADGGATCVDGPPVDDGTVCAGPDGGARLCTAGACLAPTVVSGNVNLSTATLTPGRTCVSEAPAFDVTGLTATTATVAAAPTGDCLVTGDEVLLVNLQGAGAAPNTGNWELLKVAGVSGSTVTFTAPKTRDYGGASDGGSGDTNIGGGATEQKVALVRLPQLGHLTVNAGTTLTAAPWNGKTGGIVALRAAKLTVNGTISAAGLGYRSGRWSQDDTNCSDNVATEAGESVVGPALVSTANNGGGAGGISALNGVSFNGDTPMCAGSSHATAGQAGKNPKGRTLGSPGATYGVNDGTRLTMGSGNAGNVTCAVSASGPALVPAFTTTAGGIVLLLVGQLDVGAAGVVSAKANDEGRDTAASGGYVFIRGGALNVGTNRITALGATGTSVGGPFVGQTVKGGDGYVVLKGTSVTGTTTPTANVLP